LTGFAIYSVATAGGDLAVSPMPGRRGDLAGDVERIAEWSADMVISMTTDAEFSHCKTGELGIRLARVGIEWRRFPVEDFGTPGSTEQSQWAAVSRAARAVLAGGGKVLIHCMGGCGRSGMAALRLMIESGEDPDDALSRLRDARPCAVETDAQFAWATSAGKVPREDNSGG